MTAPLDLIDPATRKIATVVRTMLQQEVENMRAQPARVKVLKADEEIMAACVRLGMAYDRLVAVKYTLGEIAARRELESAAKALRTLMRRHGRC